MSWWVWVIVAAVVVIVVAWYLSVFNSFVRLRNLIDESWRQVDVELQRRHDLVPALVAVAERAAGFQRNTVDDVVTARAAAMNLRDGSVAEVSTAENTLTTALDRLRALAENYPDLTAVRNYEVLQRELADTEDRIAASRRLYNSNVRTLNTRIQSMPSAAVAALHRVGAADYFEISEPAARDVPDVERLLGRGD